MAQKNALAAQATDSKEIEAIQKLGGLNARYDKFLKGGVVTIATKEQADEAGILTNDLAQAETFIDELWRKETAMAHQLWSSLTGKIRKYKGPTSAKIANLKAGVRVYLLRATAAVEKKEEKLAQRFEAEGIADVSFQLDRPMAAGFNAPRTVYVVKCVDLKELAKAAISKSTSVPLDVITYNQDVLDYKATEIAYNNAEVIDGKRYVYPGVTIEKDIQLTRNSR